MRLGIMQPYFFPYIGYFQLMNAADEFVVYDNIKYTKKGWINRNRILVNGAGAYITLPIKKDSDYLSIRERRLAESWPSERKKMLNRVRAAYSQAPYFAAAYPVFEKSLLYEATNLFSFILNALNLIKEYLGIHTPLVVSSTIPIDHELKSTDKVLAICKARKANSYINPIGGTELYEPEDFRNEGIDLHFIKTDDIRYPQLGNEFVPALSILDVMMFNPKEKNSAWLESYTMV